MKKEFYLNAGAYLKSLRERNDLTQLEVAKRIGVSNVSVKRYEDGDRKIPLESLSSLCSLYGIELNDLFDKFKEYL